VHRGLLSRFIGPTSILTNTNLGKETLAWVADQMSGLTPAQCRITVTGASQSGKSTILAFAVSLFAEKLQIVEDSGAYLIVPFNWRLDEEATETLSGLYAVFVCVTFLALRLGRASLVPVIDILRDWFLGLLSHRGFPPSPPSLHRFENFPEGPVLAIARDLHDSWYHPGSLEHFMFTLTMLPRLLGDAFGFTSVVYVYDHFDAAKVLLSGGGRFPESRPVLFTHFLCEAARAGPFFIASESDDEFAQCFEINDAVPLTTHRVIRATEEKDLCVSDPLFCLQYEYCRGCPGYCAMYLELCALALAAEEKSAGGIRPKYAAVVDRTRSAIVTDQFLRLCLLIEGANNESLDINALDRLSYCHEFDVHVR
jgi:hypothetical protein